MSNKIVLTESIKVTGSVVRTIPVGTMTWETEGNLHFGLSLQLTDELQYLPMPTEFSELGLAVFANRDSENTIEVGFIEDPEYGSSPAIFAEIPPGFAATVPLRRDITALIARVRDGSSAVLDYEIQER